MIVAGEPSGDLHGGNLVRELKRRSPEAVIFGIGGDTMAAAGMKLTHHIRDLSVMGVAEVIVRLRTIFRIYRAVKYRLEMTVPDLLILIDYPGFNLRLAAAARRAGVKVLYYIAPKVWAWKPSRLKTLRRCVSHVALIFPFEPPLYRRHGIPHTFVGHPLLDVHAVRSFDPPISTPSIEEGDGCIIGLLPGSRNTEMNALMAEMLKAADQIAGKRPGTRVHISRAFSLDTRRFDALLSRHRPGCPVTVVTGDCRPILETADLLIAASGTVTLEAALYRVPTLIVYRMSFITYALARLLVRIEFAGLANIIAGELLMPELIQSTASASVIENQALKQLQMPQYAHTKRRLATIGPLLGGGGASKRTASLALEIIRSS